MNGPRFVSATFRRTSPLAPPRVTITAPRPADRFFERTDDLAVAGTVEAEAGIAAFCVAADRTRDPFPTRCRQAGEVQSDRTFTIRYPGLLPGRHTLVAFLRDAVGRTHTDAVSIEVAGEATGIDLAVWDVSLNQGVNRSGAWELVNRPGAGQTVARYTGVDLVRHLPTAVRVHVRASAPGSLGRSELRQVPAALWGWRGNTLLPGSPRLPDRGVRNIRVGPIRFSDRGDPNGAYTFSLPEEWTQGTIRLTATANPLGFSPSVPEAADRRANNSFVLTDVRFTPVRYAIIAPLRLCYLEVPAGQPPPTPENPAPANATRVCPGPAREVFSDLRAMLPTRLLGVDDYAAEQDVTAIKYCNARWMAERLCAGPSQAQIDTAMADRVNAWDHHYRGPRIGRAIGVNTRLTRGWAPTREWLAVYNAVVEATLTRGSVSHEYFHTLGFWHATNCGQNSFLFFGDRGPEVADGWAPDGRGQIQGIGLDRRGVPPGSTWGPYRLIAPGFPAPTAGPAHRSEVFDFMSYCANDDQESMWISTRYWNDAVGRFRTDERSGFRREPRGIVLRAPVGPTLRVNAFISPTGQGQILRVEAGTGEASAVVASSPFRLVVRNARGGMLSDTGVVPVLAHSEGAPTSRYISAEVSASGAARVELVRGGAVLAARTQSSTAPRVRIVAPPAGARVRGKGRTAVRWNATDADGDPLVARIDYSADDGRSWRPLTVDAFGGSASVPSTLLSRSSRARIRVTVNDGFEETAAVSGRFTAEGRPPVVSIDSPSRGATIVNGASVALSGAALDDRHNPVSEGRLTWFDGKRLLGTGSAVAAQLSSPGLHRMTLIARDGAGRTGRAVVPVLVRAARPLFLNLRAPRRISPRARRVILRVAATVPARLSAGGATYAVDRRPRAVPIRVRPGRRPLVLRLKLAAYGLETRLTVRIRRR